MEDRVGRQLNNCRFRMIQGCLQRLTAFLRLWIQGTETTLNLTTEHCRCTVKDAEHEVEAE